MTPPSVNPSVYKGFRVFACYFFGVFGTCLLISQLYRGMCCNIALMNGTITPFQAIKRMRQLSAAGVPFSFEFYSWNDTKGVSEGHKVVTQALLRQGLRNDQSHLADILIAYTNHGNGEGARFFYLPLLLKFNEYTIKP